MDRKGDGSGEGADRVDDGRLDVEGHGLDLRLLDSRPDLERGFVQTRRLGTQRELVWSFERKAVVVRLGVRRDRDLDDFW